MNLKEQIEKYQPFDETEERIKEYQLNWINTFDDVLTRENEFGHFASSAFVVNKDRTKMLVVYHNIYDAWIFPGGHADGEENLLSVATREVEEETGLKTKVLDESIFAISASPIAGHVKRGKYVPAHVHLNISYLLEADENAKLKIKEDENTGVKWVDIKEATKVTSEPKMVPIYSKLIDRLKEVK